MDAAMVAVTRLQDATDATRPALKTASHSAAAESWLKPALMQPDGADQVLGLLQQEMENVRFLEKLYLAKEASVAGVALPHGDEVLRTCGMPDSPAACSNLAAEAGFTEVAHAEAMGAPDSEGLDQYVLVNRADVVDAISSFVAAYLVTLPEAQKLQPAELQAALKKTFRELRKSKVRIAWEWGRCAYRAAAMGYGVFSVYENPWLVRALLAALWTASKMIVGTLL